MSSLAALALLTCLPAPQETLIDLHQVPPPIPISGMPRSFARLGSEVLFSGIYPGLGGELLSWDGNTVELVADLRLGSPSGGPSELTTVGNFVYFAAYEDDSNVELWRSDGTTAGTEFIADLFPGPVQASSPDQFVAFENDVLFVARSASLGRGVWRTDGTEAGTLPLVELGNLDNATLAPATIPDGGGGELMIFRTSNTADLWRTDGTPEGTALFSASWNFGGDAEFVVLGGYVYFVASYWLQPDTALWRTDGFTVEAVATPVPGQSSFPFQLEEFGGDLFFVANDANGDQALFRSDGQPGSVELVLTPPVPATVNNLVAAQSYLSFTVDPFASSVEFWRTDGTTIGTGPLQVPTLAPGSVATTDHTAIGDRIVFRASVDGDAEPWAADGVAVTQLADLSGPFSSDPSDFFVDGSTLLFAAYLDGVGRELLATDGTPGGTGLVVDVLPDPQSGGSSPRDFVRIGQQIFFTADDGVHGREVWVSDGTAAGTELLIDALPGPDTSEPQNLVALGDRLYFIAKELDTPFIDEWEVWVSDGTAAGTGPFTDLLSIGFYYPAGLEVAGDKLFFTATDLNVFGREPFSSNGADDHLVFLGDLNPSVISTDSDAEGFTAAGDLVYFRAKGPDFDTRTWATDGTEAGTYVVDSESPQPALSPYDITPLGGNLAVARAFGAGASAEIWAIEPTGTTLLADIDPGVQPSYPDDLTRLGDRVVFVADSPEAGDELWITDGTVEGTQLLFETIPGSDDGSPGILGVANGRLFFRASTGGFAANSLFSTDGTTEGTELLLTPLPTFGLTGVSAAAVAGEYLYFDYSPAFGVSQTWRSDGTAAGTIRIDTLKPAFSAVGATQIGQGSEVLTQGSGAVGVELWRSRGTAESSVLVADLFDGAASSNPSDFHRVGDHVVFTADRFDTGVELYTIPFATTEGHVLEPYGVACQGSGGLAPTIETDGAARLGEAVDVRVANAFGPSTAFLFLSFDSGAAPLGDCTQYPSNPLFPFAVTATDASGEATVNVPLPAALVGLTNIPLYFQWAVVDPGGGYLGAVSLSDALEVVVGPAD